MQSSKEQRSKRPALVIGSGGLKCAATLGLWKALLRKGIDVELVVGCSGGSIFGSMIALSWDFDKCIEYTKRIFHAIFDPGSAGRLNWSSLLRTIMPWLFKFDERFAVFDDQRVMETLEWLFGDFSFDDTQKPLRIVAADLHTGDQVVITEGRLVHALRASGSIPYLWPPWPMGGRLLVDGALASPMPVDVAIRERYDIIMAVGFLDPPPVRIESPAQFAMQVLSAGANNIFKAQFALHSLAHHSEIIHIIPEFEAPVTFYDIDLLPQIIEAGERAMEAELPYLCRLLEAVS